MDKARSALDGVKKTLNNNSNQRVLINPQVPSQLMRKRRNHQLKSNRPQVVQVISCLEMIAVIADFKLLVSLQTNPCKALKVHNSNKTSNSNNNNNNRNNSNSNSNSQLEDNLLVVLAVFLSDNRVFTHINKPLYE